MEIIKVSKNNPTRSSVEKIVTSLRSGRVVVLPTETVYTFAVDATNTNSIRKVYELKGRDFSKPMHVVFLSMMIAQKYVFVTSESRALAKNFLPGPLTLVLKKRKGTLPGILTSNLPTLGVRIPNLPLNLVVSKEFKFPYTTTSANISGGANPYTIDEILKQLSTKKQKLIDLIVDVGNLPQLKPSTLIDLSSKPFKIIREGPIPREDLEKVVGKIG